jgi:hypothetical protein
MSDYASISNPFSMFSHWPLSGDVLQRIATSWFSPTVINYRGNPAVESRTISEVASFGRQIGWLSDIVLELSQGKELQTDSVKKLKDAHKQIEEIKRQAGRSAYEEASQALAQLKSSSPDQFRKLVTREFQDLKIKEY